MTNLVSLELFDTQSVKPLFNTFPIMTRLKSLKINSRMKNGYTQPDTPLAIDKSYLAHLNNLSELNTWDDDIELGYFPDHRFGSNYEIIDNMKELKVAKLQKRNYLDCAKIQAKHPEVRFQWCQKVTFYQDTNHSRNEYHLRNLVVDHYYEGEFSGGATYGGKGVATFPNGDRYEGEFRNNLYHGYGIYFFSSGIKCEASWKNGTRLKKGAFFDVNGERLGEKEAVLHGKSILTPKSISLQPIAVVGQAYPATRNPRRGAISAIVKRD